jgi:cell division septal protein FtsQ
MKKIRIPRPTKKRSFSEKFGRDSRPFGSGEKHTPTDYGSVPFLMLCMLGGVALTVAVMLLGKLWKVTDVTATDGQYYSSSTVVASLGVEAGDEMLGFDGYVVVRELRERLPLLDRVKVRKHPGGTVSVTFTEVEELYYTRHNQNYYIINAETREVLCVMAKPDEARRVGAVYLGLPECARVRVGEELSFVNLPYAPETDAPEISTYELETDEPEKENAYVFNFVETLMSSTLSERVVGMELGDRYDLWLVLNGGVRVRVGGMDELERKLSVVDNALSKMAQDGGLSSGLPILVDVSDPARVICRISPEIELPDWAVNLAS